MKDRKWFIEKFYTTDSGEDVELNDVICELENYLTLNENDIQMELLLHTFRANKIDSEAGDFEAHYQISEPIVSALKAMEWGYLELDILSFSIGHIKCYTTTVEMLNKAISLLETKYKEHKNYSDTKLRLYFNISLRLLRAKFYDNVNPEELEKLFTQCISAALAICKAKGFITYRTVLLTRQAIFNGNADKILECINGLRATEDTAWIKTTSDEIVEYCRCMGQDITKGLKNFMLGNRIQKRRQALGLSTMDFADAIGTTQTVVNEAERGANGFSVERLYAVANVLQVEMGYLFGDRACPPPNTIDNIKIYKMVKMMERMDEKEQQFILDIVKGYVKVSG